VHTHILYSTESEQQTVILYPNPFHMLLFLGRKPGWEIFMKLTGFKNGLRVRVFMSIYQYKNIHTSPLERWN